MERWRRMGSERLQRCRVFDVNRVRFEPPGRKSPRDYFVIEAPDWINVIPLTDDRRIVVVRQYRFGVDDFTLEIPGGMCDPGEEPSAAAWRELEEETGYKAREMRLLGSVHPNPAIQNNRCHSFLAIGAFPAGPACPDDGEELEVSTVALSEIPGLIERGRITHSLVVTAFHLLGIRLPES